MPATEQAFSSTVDLTGETVIVSAEDLQAGTLQRLLDLGYGDRRAAAAGLIGTAALACLLVDTARWWQLTAFVVLRVVVLSGTVLLTRRARRADHRLFVPRTAVLGAYLWFGVVSFSWASVVFIAPSPMLERSGSLYAIIGVIVAETLSVVVSAPSRPTVLLMSATFWACMAGRLAVDDSSARLSFVALISVLQVVLVMTAFNSQRWSIETVRADITNRVLLQQVTRMHAAANRHRSELADLNGRLTSALEQSTTLANRDALTGVLNRRAFLDQAYARLDDGRCTTAAIVLLDLDQFKIINDTHGHAVGDDVLVHCANALWAQMRAGDLLARWGGEEFIVLLHDCDVPRAAGRAEACRATLEAIRPPSWPAGVSVSASFGVAGLSSAGGFDHSVAAADKAMYQAKAAGRNLVRTALEPAV